MASAFGAPPTTVEAVAALSDPVRRSLYEAVRRQRGPTTRETAAAEVGISRKLAAFHLDKLVDVGLLEVGVDESSPRRVGRAPKVYVPSRVPVAVSVPPRHHVELAATFVAAITSQLPGESSADAVRRVAAERGRALSGGASGGHGRIGAERALTLAQALLAARGYEPYRASPDCVRLHNCPFDPLAAESPALVCGLNAAFLAGVVDGIGSAAIEVAPAPESEECCAEVRRRR